MTCDVKSKMSYNPGSTCMKFIRTIRNLLFSSTISQSGVACFVFFCKERLQSSKFIHLTLKVSGSCLSKALDLGHLRVYRPDIILYSADYLSLDIIQRKWGGVVVLLTRFFFAKRTILFANPLWLFHLSFLYHADFIRIFIFAFSETHVTKKSPSWNLFF